MPDAESVPFCVLDTGCDWYYGMERVWLARPGEIVKDSNSLTILIIYHIISLYILQVTNCHYKNPPYHIYAHTKWRQDVLGMRPGSIATSVNAMKLCFS